MPGVESGNSNQPTLSPKSDQNLTKIWSKYQVQFSCMTASKCFAVRLCGGGHLKHLNSPLTKRWLLDMPGPNTGSLREAQQMVLSVERVAEQGGPCRRGRGGGG